MKEFFIIWRPKTENWEARAIYQSKEIFLDEATSALDKKTEEEILKNLTKNEKNIITVVMITHRPRDEIKYNKVIEVKGSKIKLA